MTLDEFTQKTKILEEFFSKEYNFTQKQLMFEELKCYDADKYEKAIRLICKNNRYKPTLSEIIESMQRTINYNAEKESYDCKACKGTGYILYHKKIDDKDYEYACLCNCQNAAGLEYDGTKIADKEHRSKYYIKKAEEVFMGRAVNESK